MGGIRKDQNYAAFAGRDPRRARQMALPRSVSSVLAVAITLTLGLLLPNIVLRVIFAFIVLGYLVPQLSVAFSPNQDLKKRVSGRWGRQGEFGRGK